MNEVMYQKITSCVTWKKYYFEHPSPTNFLTEPSIQKNEIKTSDLIRFKNWIQLRSDRRSNVFEQQKISFEWQIGKNYNNNNNKNIDGMEVIAREVGHLKSA